jgi:hypothetical protein
VHQKSYVEERGIGIVGDVFVVHEDQDEAVLAKQHGKLIRAACLLDSDPKPDWKKRTSSGTFETPRLM